MRRSTTIPPSAATSLADSGAIEPPPAPPAVAAPSLGLRTNSSSSSVRRSSSSETPKAGDRRRNKQREMVVVPPSSTSATINTSNVLRPTHSNASTDSTQSTGPGNGNKLTRWLSRSSREGRAGDNELLAPGPINPTISISPSSSAQSHLSASSSGSTPGKQRKTTRRLSADSRSDSTSSNAVSRGLAGLSLKSTHSNSNSMSQHEEGLGEWADAEGGLVEAADEKSIRSTGSGGGSGKFRWEEKGRRCLVVGRGKEVEGGRAPSPSGGSSVRSVSPSTSTPPLDQPLPSFSSQSAALAPSSSGRIGGWFNSILNSSTSASNNSPGSPGRPSTSSSNGDNNTSPSKFSISSAGSFRMGAQTSPTKKRSDSSNSGGGAGRLGPLDRMLGKAVQYFLDSDSRADRCEEEIWVLGVRHQGWRADQEGEGAEGEEGRRRGKKKDRRERPRPTTATSNGSVDSLSTASSSSSSLSTEPSPPPQTTINTNGWPTTFYHDFYSRIALTYRTGFPAIPCSPSSGGGGGMLNSLSMSVGRGGRGGGGDGLSSDTGWGCMLRTGQSLLANALVTVHLGRDWRRSLPPAADASASSATYTRILSLFLDDPSPLSPFSVHRFALTGKQLGKEVGEWFGPSTAAGAIKALVNAFEPAGLSVVSVSDGSIYRTEVEAAARGEKGEWERPVLVLVNLRLGIDGVNPVYHEAVKGIFRFPQSVGIAGGRPSSSYYFVGAQASSLFYIDPHHPRPSIPLRPPTSSEVAALAQQIPVSLAAPLSGHHIKESTITDSFVTVAPSPPSPTTPRHFSAPPLSRPQQPAERILLDQYFVEAYSDQQMRTYHCDKVRKMAMTSLDPSMLVGFLIQNADDWEDFSERVKELSSSSKPIFSLAESPPAWMRRPSHTGVPSTSANPTTLTSTLASAPPAPTTTADEPDDFSEPEDWELDSTDASAASSSAAAEEWEAPEGRARKEEKARPVDEEECEAEEEVESIRRVDPDGSSWHSANSSPSARARPDDGLVVVDAPAVSAPVAIAEADKEAGWEGVSGSPAAGSALL